MTTKIDLRQAFRFMRGNVKIMAITGALGMFGRQMSFPYASLYILALGGEPAQIGYVNSLAPLAGLLAFPIAGHLCDHSSRVKMIGITGLFSGLVYLLFVFALDWRWIALGSLLRGFTVIQFPPSSAILADSLAPEDRGRGIAAMNTLSGAPSLIAPYVAGAFLEVMGVEGGMRVLYGLLGVAYIAGALINMRFLKETTATESQQRISLRALPLALKDSYSGLPGLLRGLSTPLRALAIVVVLGFLVNAIAGPFWVVYASEQIGLTSSQWGLVLLVETLLRNVFYVPAGMVVDRCGRTRCALGAMALAIVAMPLFIMVRGFWPALLVRGIFGVVNAFFLPACAALMADLVPREMRGRVMAAIGRGSVLLGGSSGGTGGPGLGFLVTLPLMAASAIAGTFYEADPRLPWLISLGALLIAFYLMARYVRDPQAAEV